MDGFPIKICLGMKMGPMLDECGGMMDDDGNYSYYFTDEWPYSIRCFKGKVVYLLRDLNSSNSPLI